MDSYAEEIHGLEKVCTSNNVLRVTLDSKYEEGDLIRL